MARVPIQSHFFTITVVRKGRQFLLVQEVKGEWYFPGGGVLAEENLFEAANRESIEESGVSIFVEGIYKMEYLVHPKKANRFRAIFVATALDEANLKNTPDKESLKAAWKTVEEIEKLPLRNSEVLHITKDILNGAPIYPRNLLYMT